MCKMAGAATALALAQVILVLALCPGCLPSSPEVEVVPRETHLCGQMCSHLLSMGCHEAGPLPDGTTCETWCKNTEDIGMPLGLRCLLGASSCESARACARPRVFQR